MLLRACNEVSGEERVGDAIEAIGMRQARGSGCFWGEVDGIEDRGACGFALRNPAPCGFRTSAAELEVAAS